MGGEHVERVAILGLSRTTIFSLHSLPRHVSVELGLTPEQLREREPERELEPELELDVWAFPWGS